jgi:hypothetical protein
MASFLPKFSRQNSPAKIFAPKPVPPNYTTFFIPASFIQFWQDFFPFGLNIVPLQQYFLCLI